MKIIIFFTLLSVSLFGEGGAYFGVNYGAYNESFTKGDTEAEMSNSMAVKIGYGIRSAYAVEFSIEKTSNQAASIQDASSNDIDITADSKIGMNVELLKALDLGIYILPFLKAGFGAGVIGVTAQGSDLQGDPQDVDSLSYGSFNLGLGFFVPLGENFDIELGYDYKYLSYENLDSSTTSQEKGPEFESHVNKSYIGLNYRF